MSHKETFYTFYIEKTDEFKHIELRAKLVHLGDLFKAKGYMYLNEIYETLDIKWNPKDENRCWIRGEDKITFNMNRCENGFVLTIT